MYFLCVFVSLVLHAAHVISVYVSILYVCMCASCIHMCVCVCVCRAVEDKNIGPLVKTIMTRCIHCTRCIR